MSGEGGLWNETLRCGEGRLEENCISAVVCLAVASSNSGRIKILSGLLVIAKLTQPGVPKITTREEQCRPPHSNLCEEAADTGGIVKRNLQFP